MSHCDGTLKVNRNSNDGETIVGSISRVIREMLMERGVARG